MSKRFAAVLAALLTTALLASCAAKNVDEGAEGEDDETTATTAEGEGDGDEAGDTVMFGDLESPCGPGDYTVEASEAGKGADKLYLGVANDRTSTIRNGLNKEVWDASNAFVAWCNEQGGIGGLPIEIVDVDGKLLEVESAMVLACNDVFMMVGGGQVQDNLQFSGKPESDFHECELADIPGFAVSPEKSGSNGQVQPLPNPADVTSGLQIATVKEFRPEAAEKMAVVWGDLPAMQAIRNQHIAAIESQDVDFVGEFGYPVTGLPDWTPLAKQIIDSGATAFTFVGEPTNLGSLVAKLREQGWEGTPVLETNAYDQVYIDSAGAENAQGSMIRTAFHPFEEADQWPAVQQYIDIVNENVADPKIALLGMQSFTAWLLFATAANDCAASNDDVLTRTCVLEAADAIEEWTGGGLHAATQPGTDGEGRPSCEMVVDVSADGTFERIFPELGSEQDNGEGFYCEDDILTEVPDNEGLGVVDPDRDI